jgi:hypothetical protein
VVQVSERVTDPARAHRGLQDVRWLAEILWARAGDAVTVGATASRREGVEAYAVVPALSHPRFLVPLASRAAAGASLLRYNRLRSGSTRAARWAIGVAMRAGLGPAFFRNRVVVGNRDQPPVLTQHLRQVLGRDDITVGVGIGRPDPTRKPVLQIFSLAGHPLGFAKLGWNVVTSRLVETEATALRSWEGREAGLVRVPRLLHHGRLGDLPLNVTAPLPSDVRAHRRVDRPPPPEALREVASLRGVETAALRKSTYWRQLRARLHAAMEGGPERIRAVLGDALEALETRAAGLEMDMGTWHGDWAPWNLGWSRGHLYVLDWEHCGTPAPIGLDALHYHFQVELILRGRDVGTATAAARNRATPLLRSLGVRHGVIRWVVLLHLLEVFLRADEMQAAGGGAHARLYPAILDPIRETVSMNRSALRDGIRR